MARSHKDGRHRGGHAARNFDDFESARLRAYPLAGPEAKLRTHRKERAAAKRLVAREALDAPTNPLRAREAQ